MINISTVSGMACNASTAVNQRKEVEEDDWRSSSSTTTTSSSWIGMNSDGSADGGDCDEDDDEVESSYKGGLDIMDSLQQVLPMRFVSILPPLTVKFLFLIS